MKYFNKVNIKEGILWCLFFILTFIVGYYHGSSPETQLSYHYSETKNIDFLVFNEQLPPTSFIHYIEKETHSKIKLIKKNNYEDLRTELIINKNILLALVPENFTQPLFKDNRIKNIEPLRTEIENQIHFDLLPKNNEGKIYSLPVYWFINVFSITKDKPDKLSLINHIFLDKIKKQNPKWNISNKVKIEYHPLHELPLGSDLTETTIQQAENKKIPYQLDKDWSHLILYSLIIPNNTPDKDLSFKILKIILTEMKVKLLLQQENLGHPWKDINSDQLTIFHSPEALRNLNFNSFNPNYSSFDEKYWKEFK